MWDKIKDALKTGMGFYTSFFIFIWLISWTLKAIKGYNFDLNALKDIYVWLMTQLNLTHGIDSVFNSPRGEMPENK
jgi:hypothetical protein